MASNVINQEVTNEHGENLGVATDTSVLDPAGHSHKGIVQIVDSSGNLVALTAEQLIEAGIDVSNITEADVEILLRLAEGQALATTTNEHHNEQGNGQTTHTKPFTGGNLVSNELEGSNAELVKCFKLDDESPIIESQSILNGLENGQMTEVDDATLASMVQSGSVKLVDEHGNELPAESFLASRSQQQHSNATVGKPILDNVSAVEQHTSIVVNDNLAERHNHSHTGDTAMNFLSPSQMSSAQNLNYPPPAYASISVGKKVYVDQSKTRIDGYPPIREAIVRYIRQGLGYKVQFIDDGSFAWVKPNEVSLDLASIPLNRKLSIDQIPNTAAESVSKPATSNGSALLTFNKKRSAVDTSAQKYPTEVKSTGICRSFDCPVCQKTVHNQEVSYIIIRLPACRTCAESKIMVLDDQNSTKGEKKHKNK